MSQEPSVMKKLSNFLNYAFRSRLAFLLLFLLAAVLALWILPFWNANIKDNIYWEFSKWIIQVATLCVAVLVAFGEMWQDWAEQLPKKLTVFFEYDGRTLMVCKDVYLAGEGDIRQWGMQLGRQMMGGGNVFLSFDPFIRQEYTGMHPTEDGLLSKCYCVHFNLVEIPELQEQPKELARDGFKSDGEYEKAERKRQREIARIDCLNEIVKAAIGTKRRCLVWSESNGTKSISWEDTQEKVDRVCRRT